MPASSDLLARSKVITDLAAHYPAVSVSRTYRPDSEQLWVSLYGAGRRLDLCWVEDDPTVAVILTRPDHPRSALCLSDADLGERVRADLPTWN